MMRAPRARVFAFTLFTAVSLAYLVWRALFSINPDAPIYSWVFLALETYAVLCSLTFYLITVRRADPVPQPPPRDVRVDVFICTYNEPASLLRQTARRALAMDYPHETFLLDDGNRPEIRALADELGCGYITRDRNTHYKAGNLNNALDHSDGDLVMVLDADHLARRSFLTRLLGYFDDPCVALVQTPQVFYNLDSFQHHFRAGQRQLWHEGAIFHHAMQPGANRWNAAFFVGTGAILRRSALRRIGGFATGSITEDAFTCMRLHAAGFRSIYHDEPLAYLIAPESLHQYLTQRLRWGQGSMQILRMENPLTRPGLSWRQRLVYFTALSSFAQAMVHLAYYLAPALYLIGGPAPLRAERIVDFAPLAIHILADVVMFKLWLGPLARPLLAECYKFLNFYVFLKSIGGYFKRAGRLRFRVTTKGRDTGASLQLLAPQALILLLNTTAFGHGIIRLSTGAHSTVGWLGTSVATFFAGLFVLVGAMTFLFAYQRLAAQAEYTFPDEIQTGLTGAGGSLEALVLRANESEMQVLVPRAHGQAPGDEVTLALALEADQPAAELTCRVEEIQDAAESQILRLSLGEVSLAIRDRLFDRFTEHAVPRIIDPIVLGWTGRPLPDRETGGYYLPVQTNVL